MTLQRLKLAAFAAVVALAAGLSPLTAVAGRSGGSGPTQPPGWRQLKCEDLPELKEKQEKAKDELAKEQAKKAPNKRRIEALKRLIANYQKKINYLDAVCPRPPEP